MKEVKEIKKDNLENRTLDDVFTLFARLPEKERKSLLDTYSVTTIFEVVRNEENYKAAIEQFDNNISLAKEKLENLELSKKAFKGLYIGMKYTDTESNKMYQIMNLYKSLDDKQKIEVNKAMQKEDDLSVSLGKFCATLKEAYDKYVSSKLLMQGLSESAKKEDESEQ